ncbi:lipoprotein-releasing system permease protein [Dysgonomonas sp. PH5-45]|uniref:FtsX-like permease family protein n=1 Tax=unclassified Dysgonomonas TaxID=2630389 RepID=UPI002472F029|nr:MULTISPECIES: FtsX-like permease family protein [unclassified Dysgonomonas]MDH6354948.1 lipoprotein-releasing system permease protein [Dysgonomonas sp. PH5-45]MDH6387847.1 lipoprotein-releasing system permease protein [Dysgonomonas sp. PH5-37]
MNLPFYIAQRYLFSKKSHNAVNVISLISVCGIAVATMAMVCALSVFNGFKDLNMNSFSSIDPDLRITAVKGKVFDPNTKNIQAIRNIPEVTAVCQSIEENALVRFEDRQVLATVKGIDSSFIKTINPQKLLLEGKFSVKEGDTFYSVIGVGLAMNLGVRADFVAPLELYVPKRDVKVNMANMNAAFTHDYAYPRGLFSINQQKYDEELLFISMEQARYLFRYDKEVTSLDISLKNEQSVDKVKAEIKSLIGQEYNVKDRYEQQEETFRMVNIEKWVTFLILVFILVIAVFNIIGSLSMLILDKNEDVRILQNLGANNNLISKIFLFEGWLISMFGTIIGLLLGIGLCLLQQHFGLLKLNSESALLVVNAYPVVVEFLDILAIFLTVSFISLLSVLYPVSNLRSRLRNRCIGNEG